MPKQRLRVIVYAVWDMCTGYTLARYTVAKGENALDAMNFLCWALAGKDDPRIPFHGVPDDLWSDQGPLLKSAAARDLLSRLGIRLVKGAPHAKERMGGVPAGVVRSGDQGPRPGIRRRAGRCPPG